MSLWEFISSKMSRNLKQTVGEKGAVLTYEELIVFAENFAKKIKNEKCCAIYCKSEIASAMALLSCFAANTPAVPLSIKYGENHCKKIIDLVQPSCIITDTNDELQVVYLSYTDYKKLDPHPALIMCTSGTTGVPKGAMLSEKNIIANIKDIAEYFKIDNKDSILISRPLYHCAVLTGEFLVSLIKGVRIVFHSEKFNPTELLSICEDQNITTIGGTPTLINLLSRFKRKYSDVNLRNIVISGECMSEPVAKNIAEVFPTSNIYHVYGLTEASPRVSYMPPEDFKDEPCSVGVPLNSVKIKILDKSGRTVRNGERGMLWIRGDNVMMGYYNSPKQTKKAIKNNWLCTGDIASITEKGWLKIHGRRDNLIIRAGMNIYPQEIEAELRKDSRTKDVLVYGEKDLDGNTKICMDISGDFGNKEDVYNLCKELLASFQLPTIINLMEELPKNGSGKIFRK